VKIAEITYFCVEGSISATDDLKIGEDVLGDRLDQLRFELFEKTRGTHTERQRVVGGEEERSLKLRRLNIT
jgi:hypothetical protein